MKNKFIFIILFNFIVLKPNVMFGEVIDGFDYWFSKISESAIITKYHGNIDKNLIIPSNISFGGKSYVIESIYNNAFSNHNELVSVEIPTTIKQIGEEAFSNCSNLQEILIPNSIRSIASTAFKECDKLNFVKLMETDVSETLNFSIIFPHTTFIYTILSDEGVRRSINSFEDLKHNIIPWEDYYNNNKIKDTSFKDLNEIQNYIKSQIETWQKKDEFESTEEWKERVNEKTREQLINNLCSTLISQHNSEINEIKEEQIALAKEYEKYTNKMVSRYYQIKIYNSKSLFLSTIELMPYDADHQTFLIHSKEYGDLLLPVPKNEAPSFKQNWNTIKNSINPVFVPNGEDVALSKLVFKNNGKEYVYDSHTQANYAIADVKYNFAPIELADIDLNSLKIDDIAVVPEDVNSKIISKTTSDVIKPQNAQIDRVKISASEKSDVDFTIPQNNVNKATNTFAIIIANEKYHTVAHVPYAEKDGDILEKYLTRAIGLPKDHVAVYKNASFGNMAAALKHIENLSEAFGNDLNLIFYYAGHGMPNEKTKNPMLVPVDGNAAIPETCYELDRIISKLGGLNANSVVVMLDACFSGTERGDGMLMAARGIRIKSNQSTPTGNMVILTASQGDETAYPYETEQHGLFTYFLLKKLQENKGDVTLGELADYITEQVKRQSVVSNGKLQTPTVSVSPSFQNEWRNFKLK